jgi:hypothetical protein
MVVLQRTELRRNRLIYFLTIVLAISSMTVAVSLYSQSTSDIVHAALVILAGIGILSLILCLIQLYAFPGRSHVLLVHRGDEMIIATNALHEGFKLRFLRDVLTDNVSTLTDEERARWKFLEADGYYPALCIRNPKKILMLKLCTMIFDDVFAVDAKNRWEHHDCSSTSDPSFANADMPPLKVWQDVGGPVGSK